MSNNTNRNTGKKAKRGFASMSPEKQREIASKGGRAAHEKGTAHEFTSEEAKEAGRKGGKASHSGFRNMDPTRQREIASKGGRAAHEKGTAHEFTSEEARRAGQKGGRSSGGSRKGG
jgi:general stress protein YciG